MSSQLCWSCDAMFRCSSLLKSQDPRCAKPPFKLLLWYWMLNQCLKEEKGPDPCHNHRTLKSTSSLDVLPLSLAILASRWSSSCRQGAGLTCLLWVSAL